MEVADGMTTELMIAPAGSLGQRRTSSRSVNAAEAIEGYLEALRKHGDPIPVGEEHPSEARREAVTVKLSPV